VVAEAAEERYSKNWEPRQEWWAPGNVEMTRCGSVHIDMRLGEKTGEEVARCNRVGLRVEERSNRVG
jgi:hypothetical protein